MLQRSSLLALLVCVLSMLAACLGGERQQAGHEPVGPADVGAPAGDSDRGAAPGAPDAPSTRPETAEVVFASNAFPPTLPYDDSHSNAWQRDDCILCHEAGIRGAPLVQHTGMSAGLLDARCRTCHVASGPPEPGEVTFARRAFPPTLPADDSHSGAWLRDDCLLCHETGVSSAPLVRHQGMSDLLLAGRCRTCHVPVAPEESY